MVRPAVPQDLDAVWAMCVAVKQRLAEDSIPIWDNGYPTRDIFAEDLGAGGLFVAVASGRVVGSISCNADICGEYFFDLPAGQAEAEARALVAQCGATLQTAVSAHRLMVLPAARRTGAAAALLSEAERRFAAKWMLLFAAPFNGPALHLYQKLGYRDFGEIPFSFGAMRYLAKPPAEPSARRTGAPQQANHRFAGRE